MGMPVNDDLLSVRQKSSINARRPEEKLSPAPSPRNASPGLALPRNVSPTPSPRNVSPGSAPPRNVCVSSISFTSSSPNIVNGKTLDRKSGTSELPPIGIKPSNSSYSSPASQRQYDSPLELPVENYGRLRNRRSPLSPTSTTSSPDGSNRSNRLSPSAGGLHRSRTWTGDLNNSQNGSGKLETLYEATAPNKTEVERALAQLSVIQESKTDMKESKMVPASTVMSPPPIDHRHIRRNNKTTTLISPPQAPSLDNNNNNQLPAGTASASSGKAPLQLTTDRLSQENLLKHRNASQSSSISSSVTATAAVKANSDTGYDTDDEKEHMIVKWLLGVEEGHTENSAETTDISTVEKRDTAIHIVYEGDDN